MSSNPPALSSSARDMSTSRSLASSGLNMYIT